MTGPAGLLGWHRRDLATLQEIMELRADAARDARRRAGG